MSKLEKKIKISTTLELITGLHIGGSTEMMEIGGVDLPVIKAANKDNQPYIPGSSLKGKIRCLLEQTRGISKVGGDPKIDNLFGSSDAKNPSPSKVIFRDSYLQTESAQALYNNESLVLPYTEVKFENTIDRVKGTAQNPRQSERIPAGVKFDVEIILNVWSDDNETELVELLEDGIRALENDYLGGSGSRGYGQVKFSAPKKEIIKFETA